MLIKFIGRGQGKGSDAISYVLGEKDHKGLVRAVKPMVLRGNPKQTGILADSLEYKHKYRSAVIAWHPSDQPTAEQINETLDLFERLAFAGLEADQYDYTAVLHTEEASQHIHIIIPRVELSTGKSYNPSPPGWRKYYDPLRDYLNAKYGWKSPDNSISPEITRITQPGIDALRKGDRYETKKLIEEYLLAEIEDGRVSNREQIVISLQGLGFDIPRLGKDYITIFDAKSNQRIRLKGVIYDDTWSVERTIDEVNRSGQVINPESRNSRAEASLREFESRISERAIYNQTRYPSPIRQPVFGLIDDAEGKPILRLKTENGSENKLDEKTGYNYESLSWHLLRQLGGDAIFLDSDQPGIDVDRAERERCECIKTKLRKDSLEQMQRESEVVRESNRELSVSKWIQNIKLRIINNYDGIRAAASGSFRSIVETIRGGHERSESANRNINDACDNIDHAIQRSASFFGTGITRLKNCLPTNFKDSKNNSNNEVEKTMSNGL